MRFHCITQTENSLSLSLSLSLPSPPHSPPLPLPPYLSCELYGRYDDDIKGSAPWACPPGPRHISTQGTGDCVQVGGCGISRQGTVQTLRVLWPGSVVGGVSKGGGGGGVGCGRGRQAILLACRKLQRKPQPWSIQKTSSIFLMIIRRVFLVNEGDQFPDHES